ncbi:MAG TPA: sugar phosphate isomerase/epimerase [Armatimonadota bacterium]|nr:sugar phosphate isomerase/epimerase [Armatimonadota bacterium]
MSRIALQMYTMRDYMNDITQVADTLQKVSAIGYRNVQISVPAFMTVRQLREMLDANDLKADSVFAPSMTIPENIDSILETAQILGTDVLRTDSIPKELCGSPEGYRTYAAQLNTDGALLHSHGMKFYYHFHAFEFIRFAQCRGIDILLNETDPDTVGFQPDVFWLTAAGTEPSTSLKLFKGRAEYMHVKDYVILPRLGVIEDVQRTFAPVGMGNLHWPGIIKTADEIGIKRFVVEQDSCDGDPFEAIRASFDNLRGMGLE